MMVIFGWIISLLIMLLVGIFIFLTVLNMGGTCNIGGIPNTPIERFIAIVIFPIVYIIVFYYLIVLNIPFEVTLK